MSAADIEALHSRSDKKSRKGLIPKMSSSEIDGLSTGKLRSNSLAAKMSAADIDAMDSEDRSKRLAAKMTAARVDTRKSDKKSDPKEESQVQRLLAKLRHPMRTTASDSAEEMRDEAVAYFNPAVDGVHITTSEYAASVSHAMIQEVAMYMQGDEGIAALGKVFKAQAKAVAEVATQLLLSGELKEAYGMAGLEIVAGTSQGLDKRMNAEWQKLPKVVAVSVLPLVATFGCLFMLGLLLALWRFALFGLH